MVAAARAIAVLAGRVGSATVVEQGRAVLVVAVAVPAQASSVVREPAAAPSRALIAGGAAQPVPASAAARAVAALVAVAVSVVAVDPVVVLAVVEEEAVVEGEGGGGKPGFRFRVSGHRFGSMEYME